MYVDNEAQHGSTDITRGESQAPDCDHDSSGDQAAGCSGVRGELKAGAVLGEAAIRRVAPSAFDGGGKIDGGGLRELIKQGEQHLETLSAQIELWKSMLSMIEKD